MYKFAIGTINTFLQSFFWLILVYIVQYQHYIFAELREALNLVAILTMCIHTCTCLSCL